MTSLAHFLYTMIAPLGSAVKTCRGVTWLNWAILLPKNRPELSHSVKSSGNPIK